MILTKKKMPYIFDLEEILESVKPQDKPTVSAILAAAERIERLCMIIAEHQETISNLEHQFVKWRLGGRFAREKKNENNGP